MPSWVLLIIFVGTGAPSPAQVPMASDDACKRAWVVVEESLKTQPMNAVVVCLKTGA
jgi:hypothetical protein